ncbi:DEAD/DEAH box helicase [Deinococcus hopiensis]|uniref:DEAD/DEAH box helicase domain-containing protein n=1 Tax=Deinococcus hopiensis KR-140 TaxID=695939 RepID=A0A1W1UJ03_9DEIO|nr:DEAD/DEAH box helicase [Deinococcus hopiensis]SMB81057.1 DEAD/DEAH box helicase domain-containing protein [Deinococcus hopiensis KR-140]
MTTMPQLPPYNGAQTSSWSETHVLELPEREARTVPLGDLPSSEVVKRYLRSAFPGGIYTHQADAATCAASYEDFAVTTGTASGKTLCFHLAALEALSTLPETKVVVLYPQKALGAEQEGRWKETLQAAGVDARVGRIDGAVPVSQRELILDTCRVVILTPDVLHAWLLSNLARKSVRNFIRATRLMIIDEVHTFTGVFGSNAAFLFRRYEHALKTLTRKRLQYVCASATIQDPAEHLMLLTGRTFTLIGPDRDGSPRQPVSLHFLRPTEPGRDLLTGAASLLHDLAADGQKFLCFSDSRKQTENLASIMARRPDVDDAEDSDDHPLDSSPLAKLRVLPYRSGYESRDRTEIQARLTRGDLDGIISTSALELGMDIPHLDAVVLLGVPASSTSLHQRIGRVGRRRPGRVLILDSGSASDALLFERPEEVLTRPLADGALYLENQNIQCIHAICLARAGGEHDALMTALDRETDSEIDTPVTWPDGFLDLVARERSGTLPPALHVLRAQAGDRPNHAFPLRDVETSYKVELRQGNGPQELGTLSYGQVMREAYPGAVYLYATRAYRVTRINPLSRTVHVRPEKRFSTKPSCLPTLAFPNFDAGSVYQAAQHGQLQAVDCDVMISENVVGFDERRGPNTFHSAYPLDPHQTGIYFQQPRFSRNMYTTGIVLHHGLLQGDVPRGRLAEIVLDAFQLTVPFESRDIGVTTDKLRVERPGLPKGDGVVVIYDQTYGSLRLSGRLLGDDVLPRVLETAASLAAYDLEMAPDDEGLMRVHTALQQLALEATRTRRTPAWAETAPPIPEDGERVQVLLEGTTGICLLHDHREMKIAQVYYSPRSGLQYKGRLCTDNAWDTHLTVVPVGGVQAIPGVSELGWYDLDLGEIVADG